MFWKYAVSLMVLLSVCTSIPATANTPKIPAVSSISSRSLAAEEAEVFDLVNRERGRRNLGTLAWNEDLADIAREYSRKMARERFFDHFDRNGRSVVDRANSRRIGGWQRIGENLFFYRGDGSFSNLAIRGWLKSPSHRENMLDRGWKASGIGIAEARDGSIYVTQVFLE